MLMFSTGFTVCIYEHVSCTDSFSARNRLCTPASTISKRKNCEIQLHFCIVAEYPLLNYGPLNGKKKKKKV